MLLLNATNRLQALCLQVMLHHDNKVKDLLANPARGCVKVILRTSCGCQLQQKPYKY